MKLLNKTEEEVYMIIKSELTEMVSNIITKHDKNQSNRKHNIFNCFKNPNITYYMGMGRSFDSQLGNKLQIIAFKILRIDDSKDVPNNLNLLIFKDNIYVILEETNDNKQYINIGESQYKPNKNDYDHKIKISDETKNYLLSLIDKEKGYISIPVDLLYFDYKNDYYNVFELKSGGNLDTKNSNSNKEEVLMLKHILSPLKKCYSFFATYYNNMGEGNKPQGRIFTCLDEDQILVGKDFWEYILPVDISYERFIKIYQHIFCSVIDVESKLQVNNEEKI